VVERRQKREEELKVKPHQEEHPTDEEKVKKPQEWRLVVLQNQVVT